MKSERSSTHSAAGLRIALAVSRYHDHVTGALQQGAAETFQRAGGSAADLLVFDAPGAFELIALCHAIAVRDDVDGIAALGCVITGETTHDQYICHAVSQGLARIIVQTGRPIAFGVLTCQTMEQAAARAGGAAGNKGAEAMTALIATIHQLRAIRAGSHSAGGAR